MHSSNGHAQHPTGSDAAHAAHANGGIPDGNPTPNGHDAGPNADGLDFLRGAAGDDSNGAATRDTTGQAMNGHARNGQTSQPTGPSTGRSADDAARAAEQALRPGARPAGMSYKFQRLREKLREAITGGEFAGKLPGERTLAKRFHVNAKTLSKALTDLAAEGLLDRSIGRGTYVKGTAPAAGVDGRWLVVCDPNQAESCVVEHLRQANPQIEVVTDVASMRPSYLNQFQAVIDAGSGTPESFLRDLVVRNLPVVALGHEPRTYSMHTVLPDTTLGAARVARDLFLAGHRRVAAVEAPGSTAIVHALRQAAARYAPGAAVESCSADDVAAVLDDGHGHGATALVCDSAKTARRVRDALERRGLSVPGDVSVAAVGCVCEQPPCDGYFVPCRQVTDAVARLLRDAPARPATLWLAGEYADRGTVAPPAGAAGAAPRGEAPAELQLAGVLV